MKVSVVIPCYNSELYIKDCVESVMNQTLKDIEIICVNDGSTDKSANILWNLKQKDSRIKVINKLNEGISASRNIGMENAKGEYVFFLDSDDLFYNDETLQFFYEQAISNQLDLIIGTAETFYDEPELEELFPQYKNKYKITINSEKTYNGPDLLWLLVSNNEYNSATSLKLYRRKFLTDNNLSFKKGYIQEDGFYGFKCTYLAERVKAYNIPIFRRRIRRNSIMTKEKTIENLKGYFIELIDEMAFINEQKDFKNINPINCFPALGAKSNFCKIFFVVDDGVQTEFINSLNDVEKFYFALFFKKEIEITNKIKQKDEYIKKLKSDIVNRDEYIKKLKSKIEKLTLTKTN